MALKWIYRFCCSFVCWEIGVYFLSVMLCKLLCKGFLVVKSAEKQGWLISQARKQKVRKTGQIVCGTGRTVALCTVSVQEFCINEDQTKGLLLPVMVFTGRAWSGVAFIRCSGWYWIKSLKLLTHYLDGALMNNFSAADSLRCSSHCCMGVVIA